MAARSSWVRIPPSPQNSFNNLMKRIILVTVLLIVLVVFFYPKPSSVYPTEFSVQQNIRNGMSEQEAYMRASWEVTNCNCLGIEKEVKITSYSVEKVCFGIVLDCIKIK